MRIDSKNILLIALILFLQLLVFDHTSINTYINPYIYPLIILLLPFEIAGWALLLFAFVLGFLIDLFNGTIGLHMFSLVAIAALRPFLINLFSLGKIDKAKKLNIKTHGLAVVLALISISFLLHHSLYFILESFSLVNLSFTIARIFASTLVSVICALMLLLIFTNSKANER